ncbi:hypothetical protein DITRI_Ditri05aG0130500 [Diplodiscus trichospermus]
MDLGTLSQNYGMNTRYHPGSGCNTVRCSSALIQEAPQIAKEADHVVLMMGKQKKLITNIARVAKKPVILVLLCGGPLDVSFAKCDQNVGSNLCAGYPGVARELALAEIIFGDHNPGDPSYNAIMLILRLLKLFSQIPLSPKQSSTSISIQVSILTGSQNQSDALVSETGTKLREKRKFRVKVGIQNSGDMAGERVEIKFGLSPCENHSIAIEDGLMVI